MEQDFLPVNPLSYTQRGRFFDCVNALLKGCQRLRAESDLAHQEVITGSGWATRL